ncbi:PP2C family protein-serine/threonine phosphatase, partial [bacterium]|nr:PP2C family protein-serine/threonine phosphatase [bacterium]
VVLLIQYFIVRHTKPNKLSFLHGYFFSINVGGIIAIMTVDLGGFDSRYYAGLNLVIMGVNLLLPWRAFHSAINSLLMISMYIGFNLAANLGFNYPILLNNLFFMTSTAIIAVSINYVKHKQVKAEFQLLVQLKMARDALWSEMELAKRIQTALLPNKEKFSGFEIAAIMSPAREVGGDYYDIIETKEGDKWITMGDVSGHGVDSGLIMMMVQTSIFGTVNNGHERKPSYILEMANTVIRENISRLGSNHYMTIMAIQFTDTQMTLAGKHQDVIVYRASLNKTEIIPTKGTWLGIADDIKDYLEDQTVEIEEGDLILLFTDGITEAVNDDGEMYGQVRLENALNEYADLPVARILDKIVNEVKDFQKEQMDDMTLIVIRKSLTN